MATSLAAEKIVENWANARRRDDLQILSEWMAIEDDATFAEVSSILKKSHDDYDYKRLVDLCLGKVGFNRQAQEEQDKTITKIQVLSAYLNPRLHSSMQPGYNLNQHSTRQNKYPVKPANPNQLIFKHIR